MSSQNSWDVVQVETTAFGVWIEAVFGIDLKSDELFRMLEIILSHLLILLTISAGYQVVLLKSFSPLRTVIKNNK